MAGKSFALSIISPATHRGAEMERIYDTLQRIQSLWKELEQTKLDTSEYVALMNQIRALSDEYRRSLTHPKSPENQNKNCPCLINAVSSTGQVNSGARQGVVFQFEILQGRPKNKT
jgi:hypothetical protein